MAASRTFVDIGGGNGAFLTAILAKYPALRGILFDQPHVVSRADPIEAAGVAYRCEIIGGSVFEQAPAGGEAYLLKAILHDWEDAPCIQISRTCRQGKEEGASLLVVERDLGAPHQNPDAKFSDLNMVVGPMGQERTPGKQADLFAAAGFAFVSVTPSPIGTSVYEEVAVLVSYGMRIGTSILTARDAQSPSPRRAGSQGERRPRPGVRVESGGPQRGQKPLSQRTGRWVGVRVRAAKPPYLPVSMRTEGERLG